MTVYNVVNPSAMVAGQPEDVSVLLANFNAIAAVLNGNLDNGNLNAAAAIAASKLAGYPADATKALLGDGSWGPAGTSALLINQQGGSYTLVLSDANKLVEMSGGGTLTIPLNSAVPFPIGTQVLILQSGAAQVTVGGSPTINGAPGLKLFDQWSAATLIKRGTDTWAMFGRTSA